MSFMVPEILKEGFFEVETREGTECIPLSVCGPLGANWRKDLQQYCMGKIDIHQKKPKQQEGFLARMQAPGYLDCTEWTGFATELEALECLIDMYGTQDDGEQEDWEKEVLERIEELKKVSPRFRVIVGNIGTVYDGLSEDEAKQAFTVYKAQSLLRHGRASGEEVTLMQDEEVKAEFIPAGKSHFPISFDILVNGVKVNSHSCRNEQEELEVLESYRRTVQQFEQVNRKQV